MVSSGEKPRVLVVAKDSSELRSYTKALRTNYDIVSVFELLGEENLSHDDISNKIKASGCSAAVVANSCGDQAEKYKGHGMKVLVVGDKHEVAKQGVWYLPLCSEHDLAERVKGYIDN